MTGAPCGAPVISRGSRPHGPEPVRKVPLRQVFALLLAALLGPGAAAAQTDDTATRGAALYGQNCLVCHGPTAAEGEVGDIRWVNLDTITSAVSAGPGMMPAFRLTTDEITAIAAHLARLRAR